MKIALVNPQTDNPEMREMYVYHENLALGLAAAALRQDGHDVTIIDLRVDGVSERAAVRRLAAQGCRLVGVSVNYATLPSALKLAQLMALESEATLVLGGEHATYLDDDLLARYPCVDYVIRGEGEQTLRELARRLEEGETPRDLRGVSFYDDEHGVVRNPNRAPVDPLDSLPFAARDVAVRGRAAGIPVEIGILGQRGCPFPCSFCNANRFLGNDTFSLRFRTPKNVVDEMESLLPLFEGRDLLLRFYDATFVTRSLTSRQWVRELCAELRRRDIRIPFDTFVRSDSFDFDNPADHALIRELHDAGMVSTYLGLEAGDDDTLDVYNKKVHTNASLRAIAELSRLGVAGSTNGVITFHQQVTLRQIRNTLDFLKEVGLCTLWNLGSRVETLPGIRLGDEMTVRPRSAVWDVTNYDLDDPGATQLMRLLDHLNDSFMAPRLEDHLTRRLRDLVKIRGFYDGDDTVAGVSASLERDLATIQARTHTWVTGVLDRLEEGAPWPDAAPDRYDFVQTQTRALGALQVTYLPALSPTGQLEPVLAG